MSTEHVYLAFGLTILAGLATGIGSLIAFVSSTANKKFLSVALGFSAGVMIYVAMIEIFVKARESLVSELGSKLGSWATVGAFFGGIFLIALIDRLIPSYENPHELHTVDEIEHPSKQLMNARLHRVGIMVAIALTIHNFPEDSPRSSAH